MEEEEKIEWDLEELKKAYLDSAEEYDRLMETEEKNE
jgi:PHD/YefM family antitoxin component YafN of YafNO toxin-antitoxin module